MKLSLEVLKSLIQNSSLDYRKKNVVGQCPWCNSSTLEFGISVENNHLFGCYRKSSCGETGNIFKLLKKLNRLDLIKNAENITIASNTKLEDIISQQKLEIKQLPEIFLPIGWKRLNSHAYLNERGFTKEDYDYYEVGKTVLDIKLKDRIIFLIRQNQKLVGTVSRTVLTKEEIRKKEVIFGKKYPRYVNSSTDFESLLLGIDECNKETNTVILVEGIFAKRNVDQQLLLRKNNQIKCCCTFGAKISKTQLLLLHQKEIQSIILMYDPDVIQQIKKYGTQLLEEFESVRIALIPWADKDPADLSKDQMQLVFNNLKSVIEFHLNVVQILDLK